MTEANLDSDPMLPCFESVECTTVERSALSRSIAELARVHPEYHLVVPPSRSYDEYVVAHAAEISAGLNYNWAVIAPLAHTALLEAISWLQPKLEKILESTVDGLVCRGLFEEVSLPATPRRMTESVYSAETPIQSYIGDYVLLGVAHGLRRTGGFVQSNINYVEESGRIRPLYAHIDRGTSYTILGCLRADTKQATRFALLDAFIAKGVAHEEEEGAFSSLLDRVNGRAELSTQFLREERNWDELRSAAAAESRSVGSAFERAEKRFNGAVDGVVEDERTIGIDLRKGDLLIFRNASLVHGRDTSHVTSPVSCGDTNADPRWLRALFL